MYYDCLSLVLAATFVRVYSLVLNRSVSDIQTVFDKNLACRWIYYGNKYTVVTRFPTEFQVIWCWIAYIPYKILAVFHANPAWCTRGIFWKKKKNSNCTLIFERICIFISRHNHLTQGRLLTLSACTGKTTLTAIVRPIFH